MGSVFIAKRPNFYFNRRSKKWSESVEIPIILPPGVQPDEAPGFRDAVTAMLEQSERAAQERMRQERRKFLGAERAKRISYLEKPAEEKPREQLDPTFAAGRGNPEARKKAAAEKRAFQEQYRIALKEWRAGNRGILFPEGTWQLRVFHNARTIGDCSQVGAA